MQSVVDDENGVATVAICRVKPEVYDFLQSEQILYEQLREVHRYALVEQETGLSQKISPFG